jgi:hypothetical protein
MASMTRVWDDQEGNFLEVPFRESRGYFRRHRTR